MDCCVMTWIYSTVSDDLQQSLTIRDPSARQVWLYLEDEFLGQRESHALLLEAEFRSFKQGDLSITDYCRRLETMAASLKEFGDPIGDRQLVLTLLRGLNEKYRHMVSNLKMQRPFPTFPEARTLLLLEEIDVNDVHGNTPLGIQHAGAPRGKTTAAPSHCPHWTRRVWWRPLGRWPQPPSWLQRQRRQQRRQTHQRRQTR
jgi:hypothetical protein